MQDATGIILITLSILVALFAAATGAYDILYPPEIEGTSASEAGFKVGAFIGTIIRTFLLACVAMGLFYWAKRIMNPEKFTPEALTLNLLTPILETHKDEIPSSKPPEANLFEEKSPHDLSDIYEHLDREQYPERFRSLLWVMSELVATARKAKADREVLSDLPPQEQ